LSLKKMEDDTVFNIPLTFAELRSETDGYSVDVTYKSHSSLSANHRKEKFLFNLNDKVKKRAISVLRPGELRFYLRNSRELGGSN